MASIRQRISKRIWAAIAPAEVKDELRALVEHAQLSEPGWIPMSNAGMGLMPGQELDPLERKDALEASYYYWQRDPLMGRAVQLIRDYTFGRGVTWRAKDPRVAAVLTKFWDRQENRILTRAEGQWELGERLQLAGEIFPIFFVNKFNGRVKVRLVEPTEINQVITDPDDRDQRLYYERQWIRREFNWYDRTNAPEDGFHLGGNWNGGETKLDYIPDWKNKDLSHATVGDDENTLVMMHQVKINSHGLRGVPLYFRVIPWVKAYKGFMEDRATLTLALATFAFKQKIKGAASAVARLAQQWGGYVQGRYGGSRTGKERAEGAQTLIENDAVNLEQFKTDTGATNAYMDGRMIRQQVAAGTGITEQNLTGDPSVANLASATQMEGPMLKMFESWQQIWKDFYLDVFQFVISMAIQYGNLDPTIDRTVEVDFPNIVSRDLATIVNAVSQLINAQTSTGETYIPAKRLAVYLLQAFGENDIDTALAEIEQANAAAAQQADQQAGQPAQESLQEAGGEDYRRSVRAAVRQYWKGEADRFQFIDGMIGLIRRGLTRAFQDGAKAVGVLPDELTPVELTALEEKINDQYQYVLDLAKEIEANRDSEGKLGSLFARAELWINRFGEIKEVAMNLVGQDQKLEWVLGQTEEHCADCQKLAGRVYRASVWAKYGIAPKSRELACGGWLCDCERVPTSKPATKGRPPKLTGPK